MRKNESPCEKTKVHAKKRKSIYKKRKSMRKSESPCEKAKVHVSTNLYVEIKNESPFEKSESPL